MTRMHNVSDVPGVVANIPVPMLQCDELAPHGPHDWDAGRTFGDYDGPTECPGRRAPVIYAPVWRVVKGRELGVGMRLRFGNVVSTLGTLESVAMLGADRRVVDTWQRATLYRHGAPVGTFRVDPRQSYRVLYSAPRNRGGVPIIESEA
jgi:hypothetical protein